MKTLYEILVPCQWNNGVPIRTRHHKAWDEKIMHYTNGVTINSPALGRWLDDDRLYTDRVIPVRISCDSSEIEKIADITIEHYEQLAVMYYIVSEKCAIKYASDIQKQKFKHV